MIALRIARGRRLRIGSGLVSVSRFSYSSYGTLADLGFGIADNPHHRMRKFLESKGWWSDEEEEVLRAAQKKTVMSAFQAAEKLSKPSLKYMFNDVYDEQPWNLVSSFPPFHTMRTRG